MDEIVVGLHRKLYQRVHIHARAIRFNFFELSWPFRFDVYSFHFSPAELKLLPLAQYSLANCACYQNNSKCMRYTKEMATLYESFAATDLNGSHGTEWPWMWRGMCEQINITKCRVRRQSANAPCDIKERPLFFFSLSCVFSSFRNEWKKQRAT